MIYEDGEDDGMVNDVRENCGESGGKVALGRKETKKSKEVNGAK
jgi:hypothetical protein